MREEKLRRIGFLVGALVRSLIGSGGFQWSASSTEEFPSIRLSEDNYFDHRKIKAVWLEEESKKAEAVNWSRLRARFC